MAGRNKAKLETVAQATGADVELIVADADDESAMAELCESTSVVVSTVGPYSLFGSKLVAAAARAGTDYCDLTGEPQWMQRMIDANHATATETGARIVHACGFDSVPSDLGVWFTQTQAQEQFGEPCVSISMGVKAMSGGVSGGTVASMMNIMEEMSDDPSIRKVLTNPYALAVDGDRSGPRQPNVTMPVYDNGHNTWMAPFVMAATNSRVVFRTHSLLGKPWGENFTYGEATMMGDGLAGRAKALSMSGALGGFMGASTVGPLRKVLGKFLPEPGEGPTPEAQEAGFFDIRFYGTTASGADIVTKVTGDRDPGYGSTAKMLGEAAVTLLFRDRAEVAGGFWTPATALGDNYIAALEDKAGLTFGVV